MDTLLLWTGCFIPGEGESAYIFAKFIPLNTDTPLIWTPHYYGQVALSLEKEKVLTFSLNSTRLIRTPPLYGHLIIMDSLLCPWRRRKRLHFH